MKFFIAFFLRPPITAFYLDTDLPFSTVPKQHQCSCRSMLSKDAANREFCGVVYTSECGTLPK